MTSRTGMQMAWISALALMVVAISGITGTARHALAAADAPERFIETPMLAQRVANGTLLPVAERVPDMPMVIDPRERGGRLGKHGGVMRWLMGRQKDVRILVYYSYARLVGFNSAYDIIPDILERFEDQDSRVFTLHLRPGHRWSDGHPFTAEDFRYYWEDVAQNPDVGTGIPPALLVDGEPPTFEVLSETSVRYTWSKPNPDFLTALAGTLPLVIALPSHYMKQFHPDYADPDELAAKVAAAGVRNARALHIRKGRITRPENPDLPVLDPWVNTTTPPSSIFTFARNPFFHRVDPEGRQLPYVDYVEMHIGSSSLIAAKTGTGDSDLQARYIAFDDYTFLKAAEARADIKVSLWDRALGSQLCILPNLNTNDPVWRPIVRDARFRRALSLAINRKEINDAIFFSMARPSADTVLPESPLYKPEYANSAIAFDPAEANRLLDAVGLDKRDYDGIRLLPDGRRANIILETAGESTEQTDILGLVQDTWRDVGIAMFPRPTQRDLFRKRATSGDTLMTVWSGLENALANANFTPAMLAPVSQAQLQWPAWGQHYETGGKAGKPPDMPAAQRLLELLGDWKRAPTMAARRAIWHKMLSIHARELFTIGIVNGTKQPVVHHRGLNNVPEVGVFAFEPGGYFGVYHPDAFWFGSAERRAASLSRGVFANEPAAVKAVRE